MFLLFFPESDGVASQPAGVVPDAVHFDVTLHGAEFFPHGEVHSGDPHGEIGLIQVIGREAVFQI